jgi:hypothetical protein
MHRSTIGVNTDPAADVLGAERLGSVVREPVCPGTRNLFHLMVRFAEQLAFNAIGNELEHMTEHELRAAVMLYAAHL